MLREKKMQFLKLILFFKPVALIISLCLSLYTILPFIKNDQFTIFQERGEMDQTIIHIKEVTKDPTHQVLLPQSSPLMLFRVDLILQFSLV